ncbi:MAG: hypothetical protein ACE5J2_02855 [Nitrososphaerales archaeon]
MTYRKGKKKLPRRMICPDLTGKLKINTLEFFAFNHGWHSSKVLYCNPVLRGLYFVGSGWRCLSMRLLRYYRDGLLLRRRGSRSFEYCITWKGEDRLIHLWKKLGYLDVDRKLTDPEKGITEIRLRKIKSMGHERIALVRARRASHQQEMIQELIESLSPHQKMGEAKGPNNLFIANRDVRSKTKLNVKPRISPSESLAKLMEQTKKLASVKRTDRAVNSST